MSANSKIEWCHHTFNPWWGCVKVSAGCANCYAERDANRYGMKVWGPTADRRFFGDKHWHEPVKWNAAAQAAGQRHRVFCASMADIGEDRADLLPWLFRLMDLIRRTPDLDWQLVTKRPEHLIPRMGALVEQGGICPTEEEQDKTIVWLAQWLAGTSVPPNVWLLTSVENQDAADRRIPELLKVPAVVHGLSMEPLLGPVDLRDVKRPNHPGRTFDCLLSSSPDGRASTHINWVIVGGESGPNARPMHPDWARVLRRQSTAAGVPFFFKQWGEWAPPGDVGTNMVRYGKKAAGRLLDGREWNEFPGVPK